MKKTVAIYGVGMMGGSLALALQSVQGAQKYRVLGIGRDRKKLLAAHRKKICSAVYDDAAPGVAQADIVVLCMRAEEIVPSMQKILTDLKPGAIVTDIGSVKFSTVDKIGKILQSCQRPISFVGSHPMTGSEKTGFIHADSSLYKNATTIICPTENSSLKSSRSVRSVRAIEKLWRDVGAKTIKMPAAVHDILVAQTSHLPHVLAGTLSLMMARLNNVDKNTVKILAGSFRDMTRVSDADPEQWAQIISNNKNNVLGALKSYRDMLNKVIAEMETETETETGKSADNLSQWRQFFERARVARNRLIKN